MKILVLMPLNERSVYAGAGIYKALPHEVKDKTFCMPVYMDYLMTTKIAENAAHALVDVVYTAQKLYETAQEDLIIIGNLNTCYKFDVIFNFQDIEEDLPYLDRFLTKVQDIVKDNEKLTKLLGNMYTDKDSKMPLHNCIATADFLTAYLDTDPHLDEIKERYQKALKTIKGKNYA